MVKNALHKFFRMIFMRSQKLTSNNFDDLTWQKKWNDKKNWVQPTRKGKCAIVPLSSCFLCFINKVTSAQNKFPRWTSKCINFFFSPKYFFLFRSLSSAGCISVRESLSFQNNYFGEEAKIIIKLLQTQKKKMIWLNAKSSRQTKVVWLNAMFFDTQRNFFFFHAGFVWMIELVKKKCFVLSTRFPLSKTALFCQSCIQC